MVQCACSSVYFMNRIRFSPRSSNENVGSVWNRRQPTESSSASPLFISFGCHRCRLIRTCTMPIFDSPGSRPPSTTGRSGHISATHAAGTPLRRTRTNVAIGTLSLKVSAATTLPASAVPSPAPAPAAPASPGGAGSPPGALEPFFSSSSSSALLHPPVMNFRVFTASLCASSHDSTSPGRTAMRAVSMPSMSPKLPKRSLCDDCTFAPRPSASAPSSSPSSKRSTVAWSVGLSSAGALPPGAGPPSSAGRPGRGAVEPYTTSARLAVRSKRLRARSRTP
mmetsp:Transcript_89612/g.253999  ORF Transcript_89612/g.253999 Transcript_89612/m.253999 type:complete len:280 (-) Transcript_89612:1685-2524(-)